VFPPTHQRAVPADGRSDEFSFFAIGTTLLRGWRRIAIFAIGGALLAAAIVARKPKLYPATLAFVPQGADAPRSGLVSVAGQLGLLGGGGSAQQPEFYIQLLQSREILRPIVLDTFTVAEAGGQRKSFFELFEISGSGENRIERSIQVLRTSTATSIVKSAGLVRVAVRTEWPSVSLRISQLLLDAVNRYNLQTRRSQASAERQFAEKSLAAARDSLRVAEDHLQAFLTANRAGIETSPSLNSQWKRLEREAAAKMTIATALEQQLEEARIREVRDTPTVTVFESPAVSTIPDARRRVTSVLIGLFAGGAIGVVLLLGATALARRREESDPAANEFFDALAASKNSLLRRRPAMRDGDN
jgi:uncharacterized protein involved in exopolysaccharide biosynthesis